MGHWPRLLVVVAQFWSDSLWLCMRILMEFLGELEVATHAVDVEFLITTGKLTKHIHKKNKKHQPRARCRHQAVPVAWLVRQHRCMQNSWNFLSVKGIFLMICRGRKDQRSHLKSFGSPACLRNGLKPKKRK